MSQMITGIHHIAIRPTKENYQRTVGFYTDLLGLELVREWGTEEKPCCMISTGDNSLIEVLGGSKTDSLGEGAHSHLAFQTEYVDELIEKVRQAGYEITIEPNDIIIQSEPPYPARIGFCIGPVSETIEFFQVK